uniref:Uncharacterized protein n=1 Tax=Salmo trutta TaxID=8032 RepID=A0A673XAL0_SALTR
TNSHNWDVKWKTKQLRCPTNAHWSIEALLHKWNLKCLNIPLEKFHANKDQHFLEAILYK